MTDQEEYESVKKIAKKRYYEALCDFGHIPQRQHDKDYVISTYVEAVLSQWTDELTDDEKHDLEDKMYINMLRQMFIAMTITTKGRVVAQWDDRKGLGVGHAIALGIGALFGITLF